MPRFSSTFSPGRIGNMTLKNRLVMPSMVRNYGDTQGLVTKRYIDHISSIAKGGVGMMVLEASYVSPEGKGFVNELGIHSDTVIPGFRKLAAAAHAHGAKIGVQIYHAGRQASSKVSGKPSVAPSPIPEPTVQEMPHELTVSEIKRLVQAFGAAAGRAKKAGLDFVEIHGAHGYLITQFLSPFSNHRTDEYGGSFEKRLKFGTEVYQAVRAAVGDDFPILMRLSGEEMVSGGLKIQDTVKIAKFFELLGVNALHISVGNYASYARGYMIPPMAMEDGLLLHLASAVKKAVKIPVIAVGKMRTPQIVEKTIKGGTADFVAIGRTLLADPEWPNKVREGRLNEINKCIACNQGCISRLFEQKDVWCTVNPKTGRESLFAKKSTKAKNVLVIGGGPAGLSAAKTAAEHGHHVTVFEKSAKLGGQVIAAGSLPYRKDWLDFLHTLVSDVKRLGVTVRTKRDFVPSDITKGEYDVAIVATGSLPTLPNLSGIERSNVIFARDLLEGKAKAKGKVVVAGGGCLGAQVAESLATKGHAVTIVELTDSIATEAPSDERALLLARLKEQKVKILTETKVLVVGSNHMLVEGSHGNKKLPADTVVLCFGSFAHDEIVNDLKGLVKKFFVVGDAKKPRRVTEAVTEGALAALEI